LACRSSTAQLTPAQVAELKFGLQPTSVLFRKGHRLRIAIAGHDKETFARIPAAGDPTISVARNKRNASWIELPVVERK
jgi:predicted acyl esterase